MPELKIRSSTFNEAIIHFWIIMMDDEIQDIIWLYFSWECHDADIIDLVSGINLNDRDFMRLR